MIRTARINDVDAVDRGYTELLLYQQKHGDTCSWELGEYPTRDTALQAQREGTLFVMEEDGALCASMILNHRQDGPFDEIDWQFPAADGQVMVLHTLCVPPSQAGRGRGTEMVRWAAGHARACGCTVLRLNAWTENAPAIALYEKLGFRRAGEAELCLPEEDGTLWRLPMVFFEMETGGAAGAESCTA